MRDYSVLISYFALGNVIILLMNQSPGIRFLKENYKAEIRQINLIQDIPDSKMIIVYFPSSQIE